MNKKDLKYHLKESKDDYVVFGWFSLIITIILLFVCFYYKKEYGLIMISIILLYIEIEKINKFSYLKSIYNYLNNNNLLNKIGKVMYYDGEYIVSEKYIIYKNKEIQLLNLSDIDCMFKYDEIKTSKGCFNGTVIYRTNVKLIFKNNKEVSIVFKYLDDDSIIDYILEKNKNIKVFDMDERSK